MFPTRLESGYRAFLGQGFQRERQRYEELADAQSPKLMVIGCCDSRVSPEVIFDARPGEIFVVRNVANLVPPYERGGGRHGTSAALEFAVQALRVKDIVVLGHARCGGIRAFADDAAPLSPGDFIGQWMTLVAPAAERVSLPRGVSDDYLRALELAGIAMSLENLMTFSVIATRVAEGTLHLHGAYFSVASGELLVRNESTGAFEPLAR